MILSVLSISAGLILLRYPYILDMLTYVVTNIQNSRFLIDGNPQLHSELKYILVSLCLYFFVYSFVTMRRWHWYYFSKNTSNILKKSAFCFAFPFLLITAFAPSVAFCADPAPALPDLNEIPVGLSPAEIAQLHRETEENAAQCGRLLQEICVRAKEVARQAGVQDELKLEKLVDAVKFLADVDELDEEDRIPTLIEFRAKIENKDSTILFHIDKEMKRWGGRGL